MTDAIFPAGPQVSEAKPPQYLFDILIVVAVSAIAFFLEGLADDSGWISVGTEVRGVTPVLAAAIAAVAIVLVRGGTLADLGFKRPKRWALVPVQVVAILIAFLAIQFLAPLAVGSFVTIPEPDLSRYDSIAGNPSAAIAMALILPLTASIPEEVIYRGFLIGRLSGVFGHTRGSAILAVGIQALVFGSIHFMWGVGGMIVTGIMGVVWGTAYVLCDRNLWVVILAHSAGHVLLATQLYLGASIII